MRASEPHAATFKDSTDTVRTDMQLIGIDCVMGQFCISQKNSRLDFILRMKILDYFENKTTHLSPYGLSAWESDITGQLLRPNDHIK